MSDSGLHVKYRPVRFKDVVGQDAAVASLRSVLKDGTARSFLFTGPSGCGKTTLARLVARNVKCAAPQEVDAATNTGIDAMREIAAVTAYSSLDGGARVLIIDECHALSKAAWQSLLKAIEEPPAGVYWCLCTTEPGKVPETIKTRCVTYDLKPVKKDAIYTLLSAVREREGSTTPPDEVLYLCSEKADGSPRRALTMLQKVWNSATRAEAAALLHEVDEGDATVIDLCRYLMSGANWAGSMEILRRFEDVNPEGVRLQVLAYFTKVAMGANSAEKAQRALAVMDAFSTPYPSVGLAISPLVLSLGKLLLRD